MWFLYSLTFAFITSISTIIAKRIMRELDEYLYLAIASVFTAPFLFLSVVYFYELPKVDEIFIRSVLISSTIGTFAAIFAYRAIKISEISLISPISAFNPVFTTLISFAVLGEVVSTKRGMGIIVICLGAYLLELSKSNGDLLKPIKALLTNKGVQLSLAAYFLWAITPIFEKTAIQHTFPQTPPFVALVGMAVTGTVFSVLSMKNSRIYFRRAKKFIPLFFLLGILGGIGLTSAMLAFSLTNLGFATAIFKLSILFTVIFGWLFFKEKNIKDRLLGSIVMLVGVFLLVI